MHYFDNFRLLKQCYFDEKYSELYHERSSVPRVRMAAQT